LLPHKPSSPRSTHSKNIRPSGRTPSSRDTRDTSSLQRFFFVQCYIEEYRAEQVGEIAAEQGITTPSLLKLAVARDRTTLHRFGMTSVEIMLTLRGLERVV
jgi:hypothetical protein